MQPPTVEVTDAGAISERQLLRAARSGDRRAFAELVRHKLPGSYRFAAGVLGSDADAADATQNAFIAAWRELPRYQDVDRFDAWLHRILVNECRMQLRSATSRGLPADDPERIGALVGATAGSSPRAEALDLLERAFEELAPDDRLLIVMHYLEHRPLAEAAVALRMPVGTAKVRLHEAREALERALGGVA